MSTRTQKARKRSTSATTPIRITDTTLRDANQSLWAGRMRGEDILRIIDAIDAIGYYSLEIWGGEPFKRCLQSLRENPWERLRMIKAKAKNTPLQMMLRGKHLVGEHDYPDDVTTRFIALAIENGVDIFRIYDALNDVERLEPVIETIQKYGGYVQGTVCYSHGAGRGIDYYTGLARRQKDMGVDSLCINDITGLLSPLMVEELIRCVREKADLPLQLHCHSSAGTAVATYVEAIRAGAGALDCAIAPMAGYSSLPGVETVMAALRDTHYSLQLDFDAMRKVAGFFTRISREQGVDTTMNDNAEYAVLTYELPYAMYTGIKEELACREQSDKLDAVCREVHTLHKELGYPPLYFPVRNMIASQAIVNTLSSKRFEFVHRGIRDYVEGHLGTPPGSINRTVRATVKKVDNEYIYPSDSHAVKTLKQAADELDPAYVEHEEDLVSYCLFPDEAREFFEWRSLPAEQRPEPPVDEEIRRLHTAQQADGDTRRANVQARTSATPDLLVHPQDYEGLGTLLSHAAGISFSEIRVTKGDFSLSVYGTGEAAQTAAHRSAHASQEAERTADTSAGGQDDTAAAAQSAPPGETINAPIAGTFYTRPQPDKPQYANPGEPVDKGAKICMVEAMKLFNEIEAPEACTLVKYLCADGDTVEQDQPLVEVVYQ